MTNTEPKYFVYEDTSHSLLVSKKGKTCHGWSMCGMWILTAEDCPPDQYRETIELETELCVKCVERGH